MSSSWRTAPSRGSQRDRGLLPEAYASGRPSSGDDRDDRIVKNQRADVRMLDPIQEAQAWCGSDICPVTRA
jgi:hypothetical protein